ncbi:MAG TPA: ATP-binding protein [Thermoanaerobaculia bacterium]|jgi:PAS domain S-box-containing protein
MARNAETDNPQEPTPLSIVDGAPDLQALLESGEGYRLLVEAVRDYAIFAIDPEGRVASWNTGAEHLLRYKAEEILGRPAAVFFMPEEASAGVPELELKTALATGRASDDRWHVRKDGTYFFASGITTTLRDEQGVLRGFAKVMRDQTRRKQLEEELHNRAEALARADQEKDEFLATLAHELRNPLAPISYALHILNQDPKDPSVQRHARSIVDRQVRRLTRLVDDLLDISRITTGKVELRPERVPLRQVVEHAIETVRPIFLARGHELSLSLPPEEVWLEVDAARLEQVLANLLHNAAKFTPDGGRIWITAERQGQEVAVRVRDTGVGMPPDVLPRVFDLFTQGNRALDRAHDGLGIGLTLARKLVELHGGTLKAYSEGVGRGSEFVVTLSVAVAGLAASPEPAAAEIPARCLRVLIVEDNDDTAEMLGALLEMAGHQVEIAHSGPAALDAAAARRPDAILLDIGLPGLDGYQVAQRLREDPALAGVALIATSGYGQEDDKRRSKEAGFDHHLVKPVDLRRLREILAGVAN